MRKKYKLYDLNDEHLRSNLIIYNKHMWFDTKFFIIAYPGNMNVEEFLDEVTCTVQPLIGEISKHRQLYLYVTSIHCVNTVSNAFFSKLKEVYDDVPTHEYEIRTGYALEGKNLYIAKPYYGDAGILPVKRLRRKFLKMLDISNTKLS